MSEVAHPNYSGVAAIFSEFDKPNFVMKFPGNQRGIDMKSQTAIEMLATSLDLFMFAYNKISDEMPGYLVELEPIAQT